ncbi:NfeD family protein [Candidatus Arsenophonus triatominarum]|uniref:NfeD family protein n=1 Tax=Candidatus Arsenophonus triatominarum TaxID=57911 RepID=UPI0007C48312|nr:NfeD family protein [Candidatus Arsenophonus triatominarum]
MLEQIAANPYGFWLSLGGMLLIAEMLGAGGYLLWSGIAAVIVGILVWLIPFSWVFQGLLFSVLTVVTVFVWWYWLNKMSKPQQGMLNQRDQQMIGLRATLIEPTHNGYSRVSVADGSWRIYCSIELSAGTEVEVIFINGNTLNVKPVIK